MPYSAQFFRLSASALLLTSYLLSLTPQPLQAASSSEIDAAAREANRLLQDQQQRDLLRQRQLDERIRAPSGSDLRTPEPQAAVDEGPCRQIKTIHLDGATLLTDAVKTELVLPFEGHCIGLGDINKLLQTITNYYVGEGYSTTRTYIPEQDMSGGELHILVIEGKVEDIRLEGEGVSIASAFPGLIGEVFNLREFEQGIDQINRLQSNNAKIDIQPGSKPGNSIIVVKNAPRKPWTISLAGDNTGRGNTGYYQTSASFGYDNLLDLDDYLNVSLRMNPDFDTNEKLSRSLSGTYSLPFGRWTLTGGASDYEYTSIVHGKTFDFQNSGISRSENLRLDRMMFRDQNSKWQLSTNITHKLVRNFVNEEKIDASSRVLTVLDLGSNLTQTTLGGLWSLDLGVSIGLDFLGAKRDVANLPDDQPSAQFTKFTYGLSFQRPFKLSEQSFSWQSSLLGQFSQDVLFGTEQLLIGSPYTVRGFRDHSLSGDNAFYLRNELGAPIAMTTVFGDGAPNGQLKPYVGYDVGHVFGHYGSDSGTLNSVTAGLNLNIDRWSLQLAFSHPIVGTADNLSNDKYGYVRIAVDL